MSTFVRILHLEDESNDAELVQTALLNGGVSCEFDWVKDRKAFLAALKKGKFDLILSDFKLPSFDGLTALSLAQSQCPKVPFIFVSGTIGEDSAIESMKRGATDYVLKDRLAKLVPAVHRALEETRERMEHQREQERFLYVIENMDDGLVILNQDLTFRRMNRKAKLLLCFEDRPYQNVNFLSHLQGLFKISDEDMLKKRLKMDVFSFDLERPDTQTTRPLIIQMRSSAINNSPGELDSIVIILNDVTEMRREQFRKQQFLSLISHKMRTPLTTVLNGMELLRSKILKLLNKEQTWLINKCVEKSFEFVRMVDKLVGYTTLNNEDLIPFENPVNIRGSFSQIVEMMMKRMTSKKINLDLNCAEEGLSVNVHRPYLELMIEELIENAVRFNDHDPIEIRVSARGSGKFVEFTFHDNGRGVSFEEKEKIFEPFYQSEKWDTGNVQGFGLGLTIVKRLVTVYGGTIDLRTDMGTGTTFVFTLPRS